ncbi:hypothetical protein BpHYR1_046885 [Brachionus plicatilis]|uniref:Uncharacterized protein n=1 Tax=Brachionus plicatilis TaxID=10195 RepID=A0A3M7PWI7_BRAPC|nr:hypothetical protein BpHYR1_046885 [Brachionus plicatilis]
MISLLIFNRFWTIFSNAIYLEYSPFGPATNLKKSKKMSETLSKESVLEDPANQTLEDVDQDWTDVLKPANKIRKRGKAITYDLFKSFEDFDTEQSMEITDMQQKANMHKYCYFL